jgi:hypothetical protein
LCTAKGDADADPESEGLSKLTSKCCEIEKESAAEMMMLDKAMDIPN